MDFKAQLEKAGGRIKKNPYLHSESHLLADELATKLHDKAHFGYYLKIAYSYDHQILRNVLGQVLEGKNVHTPGKLFAYLFKKYREENNIKPHPKPRKTKPKKDDTKNSKTASESPQE